jgi:hypothetical protein
MLNWLGLLWGKIGAWRHPSRGTIQPNSSISVQFPADIRPEFLPEVTGSPGPDPHRARPKLSARPDWFRSPRLDDKGRGDTGHEEAVSGHCPTAFVSRDKGLSNGISRALPGTCRSRTEIPGILVINCPHGKSQIFPDNYRPKPGPEPLGEPCSTLPPLGRIVGGMVNDRPDPNHKKSARIERLMHRPEITLSECKWNVGIVSGPGLARYKERFARLSILSQ